MPTSLNRNSTAIKIVLLGYLALLPVSNLHAEEPSTEDDLSMSLRIIAGQKHLDENDWSSLDSQKEIGMLFDIKNKSWPVSIAIDLIVSGDNASSSNPEIKSGGTVELNLGIRKTWDSSSSNIHRYLGGGLALINGGLEQRADAGGATQDDNGVGAWIAAGAYWDLNDRFSLGFDIRYSQADINLFGNEIKAGGVHNSITLGYSF